MTARAERADDPPGNVVYFESARPAPALAPTAPPAIVPEQLSIDFNAPYQLLVVASERLHGATFLKYLLECRPRIVLDLRFAPHFSFTAIDGAVARRQIEFVGARYIQDPTPFHEYGPSMLRHDPRGIASKLPRYAKGVGIPVGSLMVLIKEDAIARTMEPYLIGAVREALGGTWGSIIVT